MNETSTPICEIAAFAMSWLRAPLKVGAIAPSGVSLARAITSEIDGRTGPVLELGPGTGVFTRALLARGVSPDQLTLLERDPRFAVMLRQRFPNVRVVSACATELDKVSLFDKEGAGAVVSGLPLLSMPHSVVTEILRGSFSQLRKGGAFHQFTYRPLCPVPRKVMKSLNLEASCTGFSLRNLPPAWVFSIRQAA